MMVLGFMGHEDYGLGRMGEEDICFGR